MPYICQDFGESLAGVHVHELELDVHWNSGLAFGDVGSDVFSSYVVRTDCGFGNESTSVVGAEDSCLSSVEGVCCG